MHNWFDIICLFLIMGRCIPISCAPLSEANPFQYLLNSDKREVWSRTKRSEGFVLRREDGAGLHSVGPELEEAAAALEGTGNLTRGERAAPELQDFVRDMVRHRMNCSVEFPRGESGGRDRREAECEAAEDGRVVCRAGGFRFVMDGAPEIRRARRFVQEVFRRLEPEPDYETGDPPADSPTATSERKYRDGTGHPAPKAAPRHTRATSANRAETPSAGSKPAVTPDKDHTLAVALAPDKDRTPESAPAPDKDRTPAAAPAPDKDLTLASAPAADPAKVAVAAPEDPGLPLASPLVEAAVGGAPPAKPAAGAPASSQSGGAPAAAPAAEAAERDKKRIPKGADGEVAEVEATSAPGASEELAKRESGATSTPASDSGDAGGGTQSGGGGATQECPTFRVYPPYFSTPCIKTTQSCPTKPCPVKPRPVMFITAPPPRVCPCPTQCCLGEPTCACQVTTCPTQASSTCREHTCPIAGAPKANKPNKKSVNSRVKAKCVSKTHFLQKAKKKHGGPEEDPFLDRLNEMPAGAKESLEEREETESKEREREEAARERRGYRGGGWPGARPPRPGRPAYPDYSPDIDED